MEIEESAIVEKAVNGHGHVVAHTKHCTECIGTRTQVGNLAQKLEGVSFFL